MEELKTLIREKETKKEEKAKWKSKNSAKGKKKEVSE
jgi:hypothetical protein